MNKETKNFIKSMMKAIVEHTEITEDLPIEEQYLYTSLKFNLITDNLSPNEVTPEQQDKLIPILKKFCEDVEKVIKGE